MSWKSGEYDAYKRKEPYFNLCKDDGFISAFRIYDEIWFFEHRTRLNIKEIDWLKQKINSANKELQAFSDKVALSENNETNTMGSDS